MGISQPSPSMDSAHVLPVEGPAPQCSQRQLRAAQDTRRGGRERAPEASASGLRADRGNRDGMFFVTFTSSAIRARIAVQIANNE